MTMMAVRIMRVAVPQRNMLVIMRMRRVAVPREIMLVLMMFVMHVTMCVSK